MKKYLFTVACVVALVGCSKSDTDSMGTASSSESGSLSTSDTTSIRPNSDSLTNSLSFTNDVTSDSILTNTPAPSIPGSLNDVVPEQSQPQPGSATGDQSNGDSSNRPQGAPGQSESGGNSQNTDVIQAPQQTQDQQQQQEQVPQP